LGWITELNFFTQKKKQNRLPADTGSIYTNVGLAKNINLLGRYDFINQVWEAYVLLTFCRIMATLKRVICPNYGIRLDDHTAYTRVVIYPYLQQGEGRD